MKTIYIGLAAWWLVALTPSQTLAGGDPPPPPQKKPTCSLDTTPIKYQSIGNYQGIDYVIQGDLKLVKAKGVDGRRTVDFTEDASFNFVSPVFTQLANSFSNQMNQTGNEYNSCQNSFLGASAWVASNVPPRIEAKAGGRKRTCTCGNVPCPETLNPLRFCYKCASQDVVSGEAKKIWRVDARVHVSGNGVELPLVEEYSDTSMGGGVLADVLRDLGIINLMDSVFNTNITTQVKDISNGMSSIGSITSLIQPPQPPIRSTLNSVVWAATTVPNTQPYSLVTKRFFSLYEGSACVVSKCIREYGVDATRDGLCPDL